MNRLTFRMNNDAHEKAKVLILTQANQKFPGYSMFSEFRDEYVKAREDIKRVFLQKQKENEQIQKDLGIVFDIKYMGIKKNALNESLPMDHWQVTGKGDFKMDYYTGVGHRVCFRGSPHASGITAMITLPSAMEILYCIKMDNPHNYSFETWCEAFGYDSDSRKALKIYETCIQQTMMFKRNYPQVNLDEYAPLDNY